MECSILKHKEKVVEEMNKYISLGSARCEWNSLERLRQVWDWWCSDDLLSRGVSEGKAKGSVAVSISAERRDCLGEWLCEWKIIWRFNRGWGGCGGCGWHSYKHTPLQKTVKRMLRILYIAKCSRPLIFANFTNGANSQKFLLQILYAYNTYGIIINCVCAWCHNKMADQQTACSSFVCLIS